MMSRWMQLKKETALNLLRAGRPVVEVAEDLRMHPETVRRWCDEAGIRHARPYRKHTAPFRRAAVTRVAEGESVCAVARDIGIRQSLLSRWCQQDGVQSQHARRVPVSRWLDVLLDGRVIEGCRRVGPTLMLGNRVLGRFEQVERWRPRVSRNDAGRARWQDGPAATADGRVAA